MSRESSSEMAAGCFLLTVAFFVGTVARGIALAILWGWFVVPLFHLALLSWVQALGLALVAGAFIPTGSSKPDKDDASTALELAVKGLVVAVGNPVLLVASGWVLKGLL